MPSKVIYLFKGYFRVDQAALILGVSVSTTRKWARKNLLPAVKFRGVYLIDEDDLFEFVKDCETTNPIFRINTDNWLAEIFPQGLNL